MTVTPEKAAGSVEFNGETYHFCSQSCVKKFQADPSRYIESKHVDACCSESDPHRHTNTPPKAAARAADVIYTCPMHPEIVRDQPGNCPICVMALEPRPVTLAEENP